MNFNIITLGCKVNQYESQAMREDMLKNGFLLSDDRDRADITIVNSCTVTSVSDAKNRKILNRVRRENPDGIVILTGCMPQAFPRRKRELFKLRYRTRQRKESRTRSFNLQVSRRKTEICSYNRAYRKRRKIRKPFRIVTRRAYKSFH